MAEAASPLLSGDTLTQKCSQPMHHWSYKPSLLVYKWWSFPINYENYTFKKITMLLLMKLFHLFQILACLSKVLKHTNEQKTPNSKNQANKIKNNMNQIQVSSSCYLQQKKVSATICHLYVSRNLQMQIKRREKGRLEEGKNSYSSLSLDGNIKIIHKVPRSVIKRRWWKLVVTWGSMAAMIRKAQEEREFPVLYPYKSPCKEVPEWTVSATACGRWVTSSLLLRWCRERWESWISIAAAATFTFFSKASLQTTAGT